MTRKQYHEFQRYHKRLELTVVAIGFAICVAVIILFGGVQ